MAKGLNRVYCFNKLYGAGKISYENLSIILRI